MSKAKPIMIQGTMSNVGKSIVAGGLCRVFVQDGFSVAPFKSQNMALNSYITKEGLEMGRAQVMQAEAAGVEPSVLMNPILLKPTSDTGSQVIVNGEVTRTMPAREYFQKKTELIPDILHAYHTLEKQYDLIVIEGAGSPAEINLKKQDIVNMGMAQMADAPVLLVGDIDRGGVFAQLAGTLMLLEEQERRRVKGLVINKFRGDKKILEPGLRMLEERAGKPVLGVIPYVSLDIDEEDSLSQRLQKKKKDALLDVAVIRFPRISNFTDLGALECREEVSVRYVEYPQELGQPDAVILPGSKNTIRDLLWMRQNGLEGKILRYGAGGGIVFGICGGYQMLGQTLDDSQGVESGQKVRGMGLLPMYTVFGKEKRRTRIRGHMASLTGALGSLSGASVEGYEIHMGKSRPVTDAGQKEEDATGSGGILLHLREEQSGGSGEMRPEGMCRGNVYGCYIHGIFDSSEMAAGFSAALLRNKGLDPGKAKTLDLEQYKQTQYDKLAQVIRENLDMDSIYRIMKIR